MFTYRVYVGRIVSRICVKIQLQTNWPAIHKKYWHSGQVLQKKTSIIPLVRAFEKCFIRVNCILGKPTDRQPVLPCPCPRRAEPLANRLAVSRCIVCRQFDLSNPKPRYTMGGSGRGNARRGNGAARGWKGRDAGRSIQQNDNPGSCPPANREHFLERFCFGSTNNLIRI